MEFREDAFIVAVFVAMSVVYLSAPRPRVVIKNK